MTSPILAPTVQITQNTITELVTALPVATALSRDHALVAHRLFMEQTREYLAAMTQDLAKYEAFIARLFSQPNVSADDFDLPLVDEISENDMLDCWLTTPHPLFGDDPLSAMRNALAVPEA